MKTIISFFLIVTALRVGAQTEPRPYVVLISFDGFRMDYVEKYDLTNFKKFIQEGSYADGLIPVFPSKTFPNHYSIATGLYADHHGLVNNSFYDPISKKHYSIKNRESVEDSTFYGGTPLWKLCHEQGVKSASYFWVGSEVPHAGEHPDYYFKYDAATSNTTKVNQVLSWLRLPYNERPHLTLLYFNSPDSEAHAYGPHSPEVKKKLIELDELLGVLMTELEKINLPLNVILVSDHGMSELVHREETFIFLDQLISETNDIKVVNAGTQVHIYTQSPTQADSIYDALKNTNKHVKIYKSNTLPEEWHFKHPNVGDLLIVADAGYLISVGSKENILRQSKPNSKFGVHGYDPNKVDEMHGIFYAKGPNIRKGMKLNAFENIHVYPFVAKILKLTIPNIDGSFNVLEEIYQDSKP